MSDRHPGYRPSPFRPVSLITDPFSMVTDATSMTTMITMKRGTIQIIVPKNRLSLFIPLLKP
jgi:hypothetical protein